MRSVDLLSIFSVSVAGTWTNCASTTDGCAPRSGDIPAPGGETLAAHIWLIGEYRILPRLDPQLPEALLPGWVGREVARRIERLRDQWAPSVGGSVNSPLDRVH
ncbi:MAG: hypothetical protein J2P19_15800, partial [Pseudonocardia sp.]|nr:hypothetical protein [Pseudonocardia sp.]